MRKIYALWAMAMITSTSFGQAIFNNPITGTNPNTSNPYVTGQTVDPNITVSGIGRGAGIAGSNANDRYNANSWNTTSIDLTAYFEFVLTPNSGYKIDFASFVYSGQASGTGPTTFAFRSSVDNYVSDVGTPAASGTTIDLSAAAYQGITSAVTFRLYGWNASAAGGTFSVNDFTFNGTVSATSGASLSANSLTAFGNVCINTTAGPNSFTITGSNLSTADVTVASLAGFSFSTTSGGTYSTSLTIPQGGGGFSQEIFVKFDPVAVQAYDGNIVVGGGGASDINVAASGSGVNTQPTVTGGSASNITGTTVDVAGSITANGCSPITAYGIEYSTTNDFTGGTGTQVAGGALSGNDFTANLTGLTAATTYHFRAYASNDGGTSYSGIDSFTTLTPEPSNHASSFACGATTSSSIQLTWTDAAGGQVPSGYLIKWSTVDFASIADPVDGTEEANGATMMNVGAGAEVVNIPSLVAGTNYYFRIFPYTNSGTLIDYKTDGSVPETNCSTQGAPIAAWDFTGESNVATSPADLFDANLVSGSGANEITRGAGAAASAGANSFRTTGFQNNGIAVSNTDYFQITLGAQAGYRVSLSTIDARFAGTGTFAANPGVSSQFAYSLDGTNFTLIGSPEVTIGAPASLPTIDLSSVPALQNVSAGTTITLRYYASGQTTTGGWGFNSPSPGIYGLAVGGTVTPDNTPNITLSSSALSPFSSVANLASAEQNYTVSGSNLVGDIVISPPQGYQVSLTSGSGYVSHPGTLTLSPVAATVPPTSIYVVMNAAAPGVNGGNISHFSPIAGIRNVAVNGTVYATEPTTQSNVSFGAITDNSIEINFNGGDGAKRIVLAKAAAAVDASPADGSAYTADPVFGGGSQLGTGNYVVYAGSGNSVTVTGLDEGATYHFAVFEYNDANIPEAANYLSASAGTGNETTTVTIVTYTWIGGSGSWSNPANWSPARSVSANTDVLQFNDGSSIDITDVATETIGQLLISNGTQLNLSATAPATITIGGLPGTDLSLSGAGLTISGGFAITLSLAATATADINTAATVTFTGAGHRLIGAAPGAVTFKSGTVFTAGTAFSGNAFGGTGTTANSVVFENGATYLHQSGSNPFALGQPASVVVFQSGSLFRLAVDLPPSFSGRTYADFELDAPGASVSASAAGTFRVDNFRVTNGSIVISFTTNPHYFKGNIDVAAGASLTINNTAAAPIHLDGGAAQQINNAGTLSIGSAGTVNLDNPLGLAISGDVTMNSLTLTNGKLTLGSGNLAVNSITGSAANYVVTNGTGGLIINQIDVAPVIFPVGPTSSRYNPVTIENGSADNWTVKVAEGITADPGFNTDKAVLLTWSVTPSINPPASGADISFQFDEATQVGTSFNPATAVQAWHQQGGQWLRSGNPAAVNTTVPGAATVKFTGLTKFSPYGLSNIDGPLPVNFSNVKATQVAAGVKIEWSNLTETEVLHYVVERSADGRSFAAIGQTTARENSGGSVDYSLTDGNSLNGISYYRVRSLEADGRARFSIIVRVDLRGGPMQLLVYPNPVVAGGQLAYQAANLPKGQYHISIFNAAGQRIYGRSFDHPGGSVSEALPASSMRAGVYSLQLSGGEINASKMFVVE